MSFSSGIRDELSRIIPEQQDLVLAELSAAAVFAGRIFEEEDGPCLSIRADRASIVRKYFTLMRKTIRIKDSLSAGRKGSAYAAEVRGAEAVGRMLGSLRLTAEEDGSLSVLKQGLLIDSERKRAFLRGAFLSCGTVSDPGKSYHLEFVCPDRQRAELLKLILHSIGADAGTVKRKHSEVVYLKSSEEIADLLGAMGASSAFLRMENVRIFKEMRNSVNRKVNCEMANLAKTIDASIRQVEDIRYLKDSGALDTLPEQLREAAELRLRFPDAALKELAGLANPPVGKSGMNHRLRKLSEYALQMRAPQYGGEGEGLC